MRMRTVIITRVIENENHYQLEVNIHIVGG